MKIFQCHICSNPLYFENTRCESCGSQVGYLSEQHELTSLVKKDNSWDSIPSTGTLYNYCKNHHHNACNWLVPINDKEGFCEACKLNRTIPNLNDPVHLQEWRNLEKAKHRLLYSMQRFGLPLIPKTQDEEKGLTFDFLSVDGINNPNSGVKTGHFKGVITINVIEADSVHREYMRKQMAERYRTLLGHFRHEIGHYYWERLILSDSEKLIAFRACFGDETQSYADALQRHYKDGPPLDWAASYVSKYAASHPWEDWAETWAHYLHLIDTLETAHAFGLSINPTLEKASALKMAADFDPYEESNFDVILSTYLPLTFAVNSLNRSMGQPDLYPFILPPPVIEKLRFVHKLLKRV